MSQQELFTVNRVTNLVKALGHFRPVLVNEKWTGKYEWDASAPNIHQLVNITFGAIGAMKQFIAERDTTERNHSNLMAETMLCVAEFQNERIKSTSLLQGVQTLIGQKHQCFDILDKIQSIISSEGYASSKMNSINSLIYAFKNPRSSGKVNEITQDNPNKGNSSESVGTGDADMEPREPNA